MARRIDIELTSKVDDDTWTWRAAGARQPKGTLAAKLLPDGVKPGDVVRAEVQDDIEGIDVLSVLPTKEKRAEPERLAFVAPEERRSPPPPRPAETRRPAKDRPQRGARPERGRSPERAGERRSGPRPPRAERPQEPAAPPRPKPKRLSPGHTHRNAVMSELAPEQKPIAEQLLRGGIPAVRQAIDTQNTELKSTGQPPIKAEPLLALAEELLPRLKAAEWRDRADAAAAAGDDLSLRDLRSVVTSAEVARDDDSRLLARTLREALDARLKQERDAWLAEIDGALTAGRVVRALRIASRPPDPAMRFPADLGTRLATSAGEALAPDAAPDRWLAVLDAVSVSPVRRSVQPAGLPPDPANDFVAAVKQAATRVPGVGPLVGIAPASSPPGRPPAGGARPPVPPPPPPPPRPAVPQRRPPGAAAPAPEQVVQSDQISDPTEEELRTADT
jgi:hypothetical protein